MPPMTRPQRIVLILHLNRPRFWPLVGKLAKLNESDYQLNRDAAAKKMKIRLEDLDFLVLRAQNLTQVRINRSAYKARGGVL